MKKLIGVFIASLLLIGCQDAEVKKEVVVEPEKDTRSVYESNSKPREIYLGEGDRGHLVVLLSYCWNEELDKCSPELKHSPKEKLSSVNVRKYTVPPETKFTFEVDIDPSKPLPFPDSIELFLVEDEELIPVPITSGTPSNFTAPSEEGNYTYVYKTIYDSDIKGIAFYAFQFRTKK